MYTAKRMLIERMMSTDWLMACLQVRYSSTKGQSSHSASNIFFLHDQAMSIGDQGTTERLSPEVDSATSAGAQSVQHAASVSPTPTISESPFSPLILSLPDAFEGAYGVDQYDEVPIEASTLPHPSLPNLHHHRLAPRMVAAQTTSRDRPLPRSWSSTARTCCKARCRSSSWRSSGRRRPAGYCCATS